MGDPIDAMSFPISMSLVSLLMVIWLIKELRKAPRGNDLMNKLSDSIKSGARAFLITEYRYLSIFVGAILSALAGWQGMDVATDANVRTTQAADKKGLSVALRVAFTGGAVMGFTVVGLGLFGVSLFFYFMTLGRSGEESIQIVNAVDALSGFGFGASAIALFARVAGGIYTKAADVGADLVGKVEMDIPEDDPRNPAVIADNVGDNVGDVAGMGADLFESFVGSIIDGATQKELMFALHKGTIVSSLFVLIFAAVIVTQMFDGNKMGWEVYGCLAIGLACGILIGQATEYFTSYSYWPVTSITAAGVTGPATVIIQGLGVGMISCVPPVLIIVTTILSCYALSGDYGVAMAAVGMLSTLGVTLATDAYGPVADNAGGIAEMAELDARVRETTDALDALGNTTA